MNNQLKIENDTLKRKIEAIIKVVADATTNLDELNVDISTLDLTDVEDELIVVGECVSRIRSDLQKAITPGPENSQIHWRW